MYILLYNEHKECCMKKIVLACMLIVPFAVFAEEDFGVNVPEWSDFAPKAFVNVTEPKGLQKLNVNSKYWYQRRVNFETAIDECKALEANDERFGCYETLKTKEFKLNDDYNAKLEAELNRRTAIPGMESQADNMLPLGGYMNTLKFMPNEIR